MVQVPFYTHVQFLQSRSHKMSICTYYIANYSCIIILINITTQSFLWVIVRKMDIFEWHTHARDRLPEKGHQITFTFRDVEKDHTKRQRGRAHAITKLQHGKYQISQTPVTHIVLNLQPGTHLCMMCHTRLHSPKKARSLSAHIRTQTNSRNNFFQFQCQGSRLNLHALGLNFLKFGGNQGYQFQGNAWEHYFFTKEWERKRK